MLGSIAKARAKVPGLGPGPAGPPAAGLPVADGGRQAADRAGGHRAGSDPDHRPLAETGHGSHVDAGWPPTPDKLPGLIPADPVTGHRFLTATSPGGGAAGGLAPCSARDLSDLDGICLDRYARAMPVTLSDSSRKLVEEPNLAVLATLNPDGGPQSSVVWIDLDGDDILVSTQAGRRKDKNLRRDPRASLTVIDRNDSERYIEIRGRATVTEDIDRAVAARLGEKYMGPGGGEAYRQLPPDVVRVVVRLTPDRVAGNAAD